jgi:hypothetical protein
MQHARHAIGVELEEPCKRTRGSPEIEPVLQVLEPDPMVPIALHPVRGVRKDIEQG